MAIRKGLPAKLALTDADDTRYLFSGLFVCNADGSPRSGVLSPVGTNLVTATATMNVSVKRFHGTAERDGGNVLLAVDGVTDVLLDSAPGANSRIDVIYAKQNDASGTVTVPDGDNLPVLSFAKGTAGAVPVKPSLPVGALEVATVLLPSSATATNSVGVVITQTAQFTASAGGVVPFRTKAEMDLWTTAPALQHATDLATNVEYCRVSGVWVPWSSPWITFAPTLTNLNLGAGGTSRFHKRYVAGDVQVRVNLLFGTGGSWAISPEFVLPDAPASFYAQFAQIGYGTLTDNPGTYYTVTPMIPSPGGTNCRLYAQGGTPSSFSVIGGGAPFTPVAGDAISLRLEYTPA